MPRISFALRGKHVGFTPQPSGYVPPIGIPKPPFGIDEAHTMYVGQTYDFGGGPIPYPDAGNGPYTHYVDSTHPSATDTGNTYGSPSLPRLTIPTTLSAGSVCEIHGGPYYTAGGTIAWILNGTAAKPVFVRGYSVIVANRPELRPANLDPTMTYAIVENLYLNGTRLRPNNPDHACWRHYEHQGRVGVNGTEIATSGGSYAVFYKFHTHHCGTLSPPGSQDDKHGFGIGRTAHHVWILDGEVNHCSGDGVQFHHALPDPLDSTSPGPQWVFVGRVVSHENVENGFDTKRCQHVVFSQCTAWGHRIVNEGAVSSDGSGILIGSNGNDDPSVDVWVIFCRLYQNDNGIRVEGAYVYDTQTTVVKGPCYIVGCVLSDIDDTFAFGCDKDGIVYYVNCTIYDAPLAFNLVFRDFFDLHFYGCIWHTMAGRTVDTFFVHFHEEFEATSNRSDLNNCLFWQGSGNPIIIRWGDPPIFTIDSTAEFSTFPGGSNNQLENPLFVNPAGGDFHLQDGSPALDACSEHAIYATYFNIYSISIKVDYDGKPRPTGSWDLGAFER